MSPARAIVLSLLSSVCSSSAQTLPDAGIVSVIPASQRVGFDGLIGSPIPMSAQPGPHRGMCAKWAKAANDAVVSDIQMATALLDQSPFYLDGGSVPLNELAGDQSQPSRRGRFFDRSVVLELRDEVVKSLSPRAVPFPWQRDVCRLQGLSQGKSLGEKFAGRFRGNLHVMMPGTWTFAIRSDDGYSIQVGNVEVAAFHRGRPPRLDTRRARFEASGVYPIEVTYWDYGTSATLGVFVSQREFCFQNTFENSLSGMFAECTGGTDVSSVVAWDAPEAFLKAFEPLSFQTVDLPTWVTSTSDSAFLVADEQCLSQTANTTCGALASLSCGNGVREAVNVGTLDAPSFADEDCDDANQMSGDGCSECRKEAGFECTRESVSRCSRVEEDAPGDPTGADARSQRQTPLRVGYHCQSTQEALMLTALVVIVCRRIRGRRWRQRQGVSRSLPLVDSD
jgi:cysteine-rich repeat protein